MKHVLSLLAIVTLFLTLGTAASAAGNGRALQVRKVTLTPLVTFADGLKKDAPAPKQMPRDICLDAYTAPTWATGSPSVFSVEDYTFAGGTLATVNHRMLFANWATPGLPAAFLIAYQPCGNSAIFPPVPAMVGACPVTIFFTLPVRAIWYITVGISGFTGGTSWDWLWLVNTSGVSCVSIPNGAQGTPHVHGGNNVPGDFGLYHQATDGDRPWCFSVMP